MQMSRVILEDGWDWRLVDDSGCSVPALLNNFRDWRPAYASPSVVQLELLHLGVIPDPHVGENEDAVQWVGLVDWEYRCRFTSPQWISSYQNLRLVFEGLDTFGTVRLNGQHVLTTENMFIPYFTAIDKLMKRPGDVNELVIHFHSPWRRGIELEKTFGARRAPSGTPKRMHIRKAQCQFGWDFGMRMLSIGPYKPVLLQGFDARIEDLHIVTELNENYTTACVMVKISIEGFAAPTTISVKLFVPSGEFLTANKTQHVPYEMSSIRFTVQDPELWWPVGEGEQCLYQMQVAVHDVQGNVLDSRTTKFGIRTIRLVQRPLSGAPGRTFMFNVNGRNIFCQGGNWVPGDTLLPRMTRAKYFNCIKQLKFAHHNMIRVWGGGIYEHDDFYDACDEAGMLVWQDFALSCGDYPMHSEFIRGLEREADVQVRRLRNRACLALLCGGNEDFAFEEIIWNNDYDHKDITGPFDQTSFPQRELYFNTLSTICAKLAPNIEYWVNSPWGGETSSNDAIIGDVHEWSVWHAAQLPYQEFENLGGRFVSEFGMSAFPVLRTVEGIAPDPDSRHPQSKVILGHMKGGGQAHKMAGYIASNIRFDSTDLANFGFASQVVQSEALSLALTSWKRQFVPGNERCAGALIWQINDVCPTISWSYIDYYLRPKPALYSIRRALAPVSIGIKRLPARPSEHGDTYTIQRPAFELFAHNSTATTVCCHMSLRAYDLITAQELDLASSNAARDITLPPKSNTELGRFLDDVFENGKLIVIEGSLTSRDSDCTVILSRALNWPEPYKTLPTAHKTKVSVRVFRGKRNPHSSTSSAYAEDTRSAAWEDSIILRTNYPVKSLWLEPIDCWSDEKQDLPEVVWEDNMFDLMPGKDVKIGVHGLQGREVSLQFLGSWELSNSIEIHD